MSRDAVLDYLTPRHSLTPRANGLAVFSFVWTFAVSPAVILLFFLRSDALAGVLPGWACVTIGVLALVAAPAVGCVSAFVATERGAPWDSPYRWTALAVWAAPFANVMMGGGVMFWLRELFGGSW